MLFKPFLTCIISCLILKIYVHATSDQKKRASILIGGSTSLQEYDEQGTKRFRSTSHTHKEKSSRVESDKQGGKISASTFQRGSSSHQKYVREDPTGSVNIEQQENNTQREMFVNDFDLNEATINDLDLNQASTNHLELNQATINDLELNQATKNDLELNQATINDLDINQATISEEHVDEPNLNPEPHELIKVEGRNYCQRCYQKNKRKHGREFARTMRKVIHTRCNGCNQFLCSSCFREQHAIPERDPKEHKFIKFKGGNPYCQSCYKKNKTAHGRVFAQSNRKLIHTRCEVCEKCLCAKCFMEIHNLDKHPVIHESV